MRPTLYRYSTETCQYERVKTKPAAVLLYLLSVVLTAAAILIGLLIAHDFIFDSEKEIALRNENRALQKNYATLSMELTSIESSLGRLKAEDDQLHTRFFGNTTGKYSDRPRVASQELLLADAVGFRQAVNDLKAYSSDLLRRSVKSNQSFARKISIREPEAATLISMPTLQPVQPWDTEKLISGFGMRIDPYHKGLYEHTGIDIALPRGTEVVATAAGKVVLVRKSSIPAGYGNYVEIDHGGGFVTRYAHLEEIRIRQGAAVEKGAPIGTIGNSGGSVAPHLHYEILLDGVQVDPIPYMMEGIDTDEHERLTRISKIQNQSLD